MGTGLFAALDEADVEFGCVKKKKKKNVPKLLFCMGEVGPFRISSEGQIQPSLPTLGSDSAPVGCGYKHTRHTPPPPSELSRGDPKAAPAPLEILMEEWGGLGVGL